MIEDPTFATHERETTEDAGTDPTHRRDARRATPLRRTTVRDQLREILRSRILRLELEPGSRLNETALAAEFDVSRRPIREAECSLAQEDLLLAMPEHGYFVTRLSEKQARELSTLLPTLEALAVRESGAFGRSQLARLADIDEALADARGRAERSSTLNLRWHETLTGRCRNRLLLRQLRTLWSQAYRYELLALGQPEHAAATVAAHRTIREALEKGDLTAVAPALRGRWRAVAAGASRGLGAGARRASRTARRTSRGA